MIQLIFNIPNFIVIFVGGGISWCFYQEYKKTKSHALLNSLPGVFTSLGLLGTFWSICFSLYDIGASTNQDVENTGKALNGAAVAVSQNLDIIKIISELIPAFSSSILGLICALLATIAAKWIFAKEEAIENERMSYRSPEDYIRDIAVNSKTLSSMEYILRQVNQQQTKMVTLQEIQEERYKEYNDNLNSNIQHQNVILKEFIDGFVNRMDDIFKQMHGAIEQQVKNFGEEQFTKTSNLLTKITEDLSNVSTEIINQQKTSVESMMAKTNEDVNGISTTITTVLGNLTSSLQTALEHLGTQQTDKLQGITTSVEKVLGTLTTSLSGSLEDLGTKQIERLNGIMTNYDNLATRLSEQNTTFAEKINSQLNDEFAKVQQHNADSLRQMSEMQNTYKELTSDMLTNALTMNEKSVSDLRDSLGTFVGNIQSSLSSQCNILSKSISDNIESLNKAYSFIESLVAEIKQNYDQAVLAYGDAVNIAHRTNENSEKAITATSKSLESVADTNKMIDSVLNILTERQENIENLTKQISSMSATIVSLQRLEATLNKIANK